MPLDYVRLPRVRTLFGPSRRWLIRNSESLVHHSVVSFTIRAEHRDREAAQGGRPSLPRRLHADRGGPGAVDRDVGCRPSLIRVLALHRRRERGRRHSRAGDLLVVPARALSREARACLRVATAAGTRWQTRLPASAGRSSVVDGVGTRPQTELRRAELGLGLVRPPALAAGRPAGARGGPGRRRSAMGRGLFAGRSCPRQQRTRSRSRPPGFRAGDPGTSRPAALPIFPTRR
jgi:hypothetical protein